MKRYAEKPHPFNTPRCTLEAITFKLRKKMLLRTLKNNLNALDKTTNITTIKQLRLTFATWLVH